MLSQGWCQVRNGFCKSPIIRRFRIDEWCRIRSRADVRRRRILRYWSLNIDGLRLRGLEIASPAMNWFPVLLDAPWYRRLQLEAGRFCRNHRNRGWLACQANTVLQLRCETVCRLGGLESQPVNCQCCLRCERFRIRVGDAHVRGEAHGLNRPGNGN